jgi:hypothetical protein
MTSIFGRLEGELLGNRISPTGEYINLGERTMYTSYTYKLTQ